MSYESWFKLMMGLLFVGHLAERLLLKRVWHENPCWANSMKLPPAGLPRLPLSYHRMIMCFEPNLRKNKGNFALLTVAWFGSVLGWCALVVVPFLIWHAHSSAAG